MSIPQFKLGESLTGIRPNLNRLVDVANLADLRGDIDTPSAVPKRCTVIEVHNDYLVCRNIGSGSDSSADFAVAKPWQLRKSPTDDGLLDKDGEAYTFSFTDEQSRTVTRTSDSEEEDQVITPQYVEDQDELTVQRVTGGVTLEDDSGNEIVVLFEDCNRAARAWAKVSE